MGEYRDGSGILFPNERKQTDKSPDFTGEITIDGKPMELSAWWRDGRKGRFLIVSARPKRYQPRPTQALIDRSEAQRHRTWNP